MRWSEYGTERPKVLERKFVYLVSGTRPRHSVEEKVCSSLWVTGFCHLFCLGNLWYSNLLLSLYLQAV